MGSNTSICVLLAKTLHLVSGQMKRVFCQDYHLQQHCYSSKKDHIGLLYVLFVAQQFSWIPNLIKREKGDCALNRCLFIQIIEMMNAIREIMSLTKIVTLSIHRDKPVRYIL